MLARTRYQTMAAAVLLLTLALLLVACGEEAAPTEVAVAPTEVPATETPEPTDTPTPGPTDTPSPTPTDTATPTPEPTDTPTPTDTPEPTDTPTPTNTPGPTWTPAPPTATATPEVVDTITIYYASNPSDILGVFPVLPFDGQAMYNNMVRMRDSLYAMQGALDGALAGDAAACANYVAAYNNILYSGVFYDNVPPDWQEIDSIYLLSFIYSLDRTRPAYLSCVDAGKVDEFNYGLARQSIDQVLSILPQAIDAAAAKL
jgi:hypothetical protein